MKQMPMHAGPVHAYPPSLNGNLRQPMLRQPTATTLSIAIAKVSIPVTTTRVLRKLAQALSNFTAIAGNGHKALTAPTPATSRRQERSANITANL